MDAQDPSRPAPPDRLAPFRADLDALASKGRRRALSGRAGVDFASNDYLGLAGSARLADAVRRALDGGAAVGATGSRLLRGNDDWHEMLEARAAAFFGAGAALMFGGGYVANLALFGTLPQTGDLVLMDALSHASTREGTRLSRAAVAEFRHNDPGHAADVIADWRRAGGTGAVWIAVESLYSMDGDRAALEDLAALADEHGFLVVDEAHATGIWGAGGRGLGAHLEGRENVISLHTLGKSLGGSGAILCMAPALRDFMVNRARPFIFATAPSPLVCAAAIEALAMIGDEPWRREALHVRVDLMGRELAARLPHLSPSGSQVVPLIVGGATDTMALAAALQARGLDVRGIRPPTVPHGTSRLRVSLTLNASEADIVTLVQALEEMWPAS